MSEGSGRAAPDPFSLWKQMLDAQEDAWSKFFQQMMGTEAFAASMGSYLDNLMNVQGTVDKAFERHFRSLNLPSRTDLTRLAGEVAELRSMMHEMSERLTEIQEHLSGGQPGPAPSRSSGAKRRSPRGGSSGKGSDQEKA